jgi:hypothetical protein
VIADYLPAADADKFRGYGYTFEWLDEVVAWKRNPVAVYKECLRVGRGITPRMRDLGLSFRRIITTTPAGTPIFKEILEDREGLVIGRSSVFDNAANLDPAYIRMARRAAASSPEGRQEYLGELFWAMDPTIYRHVGWDDYRVPSVEAIPPRRLLRLAGKKLFDLLVVSVDPATGEEATSDSHGIMVEGIREEDDECLHTYVLQDRSLRSPDAGEWVNGDDHQEARRSDRGEEDRWRPKGRSPQSLRRGLRASRTIFSALGEEVLGVLVAGLLRQLLVHHEVVELAHAVVVEVLLPHQVQHLHTHLLQRGVVRDEEVGDRERDGGVDVG